jgi:hypothetical protein
MYDENSISELKDFKTNSSALGNNKGRSNKPSDPSSVAIQFSVNEPDKKIKNSPVLQPNLNSGLSRQRNLTKQIENQSIKTNTIKELANVSKDLSPPEKIDDTPFQSKNNSDKQLKDVKLNKIILP